MHGWGGSIDSFMGLSSDFVFDYRVTIVDFYGFGNSKHPENHLTLSDYVNSIIEIIQHYKMTSVVLIGHSFGGRVALKLARYYGQYIDSLVLIDSAGILPRRGVKYYYKIYKHKILKGLNIKHKSGSSDYSKLSKVMKGTFINVVNEDLSGLLTLITTPTLIIWGKKDKDTPIYMAKKFKKKLKNSSLIIFENAGHYSYIDEPRKTIYLIKKFLLGGLYDINKCVGDSNRKYSNVTSISDTMPK